MTIARRASFEFIRYASVWEDADVLLRALAPVARGGRLLSIASAGDNALTLLTLDPAEVVAVDLSAAQLACVELRMAAFRALEYDELLRFLGVEASADRLAAYRSLQQHMSSDARSFWDSHPDWIERGAIHVGKFERYFGVFRERVLPLVHSRARVGRLLAPHDRAAREAFYRDVWDTRRWRLVFRIFFSRFLMGRLGRDPAFFDQVEGTVGERILARTRYALTALPTATNPYLVYILTGNFARNALPAYLRREHFAAIRERLDRIRLLRGPAEQAPGPFDGFNLSDIFEYMSPAEHERAYAGLVGHARPGARLVYWNMLVPRSCPPALRDRVRPLDDLAAELHADDRAWFYQTLRVDEVVA